MGTFARMRELFPTVSRLKTRFPSENMKLQLAPKPCKRCKRRYIVVLNDHTMCVGCNFKTKEKTFTRFHLNGWTFEDFGTRIEVYRSSESARLIPYPAPGSAGDIAGHQKAG